MLTWLRTETPGDRGQGHQGKRGLQRGNGQGAAQAIHLADDAALRCLLHWFLLRDNERLRWIPDQQPPREPVFPQLLPWRKCGDLGWYRNLHVPDWWCRVAAIRWTGLRHLWTKIRHVDRLPLCHYRNYRPRCGY